MLILAWIVLGLIAGFIGSKLVNKTGEGVFLDIVLGIVGAVPRVGECADKLFAWPLLIQDTNRMR